MPELPEVETMVRGLRPALAGATIRALTVLDPKLPRGLSAEEVGRRAAGATVVEVARRGKSVVLALGGSRGVIVIQPRMTGGFWLVPPDRPAHIRATFDLEGPERRVWYCDQRRFGTLRWFAGPDEAARAFAKSLGPDALEIARDDLAARLSRTNRGLKPALLDQSILAGVGNIYADEILHRARLHPERKASSLTAEELARLHAAIGPVLGEAIRAEGSSFDAGYRTVLGLEGGFLAQNAVHRRQDRPCPSCGAPIVKTKIAGLIGRPTYLCPSCQALPPRRARRPT